MVTMAMLALVVVGLVAFLRMPVNLLPDIEVPIVSVTVAYPGAGPETIADQVVQPVEDELVALSGVTNVTGTAGQGVAIFLIEFEQDRDVDFALQDVRESVSSIRNQLPQDINEPVFQTFDPAATPILTLAINSEVELEQGELRRIVDEEIEPQIQRVSGVGATTISGGLERQVDVMLDLQRLTALRILPSQVGEAIQRETIDLGLGETLFNQREVTIRALDPFDTPAEIALVGIPGTTYQINDLGRVEMGFTEIETYTRLNGSDALSLEIRKQSGTNTVTVAENALAAAEEAFAAYPTLNYVVVSNDAEQVQQSVQGAINEIVVAIVFASLVVFIFFRDLRNTLVTVIGLPVIIIATFGVLALFGLTINILTLLALSISVGLVIDDAIVVRENIFRHMEMGKTPREAAGQGTSEVAASVLAMNLTLFAVFVPVTFTTGTAGIIFQSFGITVAGASAISLFEAFTLAPAVSAYWFKQQEPEAEAEEEETQEEVSWLERLYLPVLAWSLRYRWVTVLVGVAVLVASVFAARTVDFAFLPESDRPRLGLSFELEPGTPLERTNQRAQEAEQILLADPAVENLLTTVGGGTAQTGGIAIGAGGGAEQATFLVNLHNDADIEETIQRLDDKLAQFPDLVISPPSYQLGTSTAVTARPIQVQVRTTGSLEDVAPVIDRMTAAIEDVPGLMYVGSTYAPGNPELQVEIILDRANEYVLSNVTLAQNVRTLLDGSDVASYREGGEEFPIIVQLQPKDRQDIEDLQNLRLPIRGDLVPIRTVANVELTTGPSAIRRANRQIEVVIGGFNIGRNINDVQSDIQERLAAVEKPPAVTVSYGGATQEQSEGFSSLLLAMGLSVAFVFMVLAGQFGSYIQPLIIMLAMPFSAIGAFLALTLTGTTLTILAMIGFIMLLGLVTKNSIMLVDFANRSREMTDDLNEAILRAGRLRLRPILMTSLTVILGSLPAAIGLGEGAGLRQGLATVVVGGMITSTLLTLLIIPVAYNLVESARLGIARRRERRRQRSEERKQSGEAHPRPAVGREQSTERRGHEARS